MAGVGGGASFDACHGVLAPAQSRPYGAHCLTVRPSAWVSVWLPRLERFIFWLRLIRPWRLLPGPASTLPVAVILNRFLTDDLVFILGISISFSQGPPAKRQAVAAGHALPGPARKQGRGYNGAWPVAQARFRRAARSGHSPNPAAPNPAAHVDAGRRGSSWR